MKNTSIQFSSNFLFPHPYKANESFYFRFKIKQLKPFHMMSRINAALVDIYLSNC